MIHALHARLRHDERLARLLKGGVSGAAAKVVAVLVNLIGLPITVRYLGPEQYGFWVTISTTVTMLTVFDLGIANTLINCISRAYAEKSDDMAKRYYATAFWATFVIAAFLGLAGVFIWHLIDWGALFGLSDPVMARNAGICAAISYVYFLLTLPLGLASKVMGGYQRVPVANTFTMISNALGLAAIIVVVALRGSVVELMAAFCAAMLTGTVLLNLWMVWFHRPRIRPNPLRARLDTVHEIIGHGMLFFTIQLAGLIVFNSDNLIIAHFLGSDQVTPYAVTWKLLNYTTILQTILVPSLWPALSEAYFGRDMTWIRNAYRHVVRITLITTTAVAFVLGFFGRWFIRVWAGSVAVPHPALLWAMCFWVVLLAITVNQAALLAATQRLKLQAASSMTAALLNLVLSIIFVQRIGAIGVLLGTIISYLLLIVAPQSWEVRRILSGRYINLKAGAVSSNGFACGE